MEERKKKYALPIPRAITTGIIFEAAEKFGLEVDQEDGERIFFLSFFHFRFLFYIV